jgi:lipoprotein-releasing system permease protein
VPSLRFSKKIALRYLWSKRSEAFVTIITVISILGVALGVMVLNIVMAVMTGFEHELREKIVGANSHIVVKPLGGKLEQWRDTAEQLRKIGEVVSVSPFTYHQALLRTQSGSAGILIRGVAQGSAGEVQVAGYVPDGRIDELFTPPQVTIEGGDGGEQAVDLPGLLVGRELAQSLGLFAGSPVSLLSSGLTSSPFGLVPRYKRFVVVGSYRSGLVEYESGLAYVSLPEAQNFFKMGDTVSGLDIRVRDIDDSPRVAQRIGELLGGISAGFSVQDWTQTNKPLWDAIRLEKKVYFIVLLLIVVMASFSIISTLIMIVLEKRRDIAVLRTLGANERSIAAIFKIQGAVIGGIGTVLGLLLGFGGCLALRRYGFPLDERIFQMSTLPIRIEPLNFFVVGAVAFLICALATIYPSRRASALQPSDVLRYE